MADPQPTDDTTTGPKTSPTVGVLVLAVAAALAAVDLVLKQAANERLTTPIDLGPLSLQLAYNTGISFSLGNTVPSQFIVAVTATITLGIAVGCYRLAPRLTRTQRISLAAILAGAAANLTDRIADGAVTDYLHTGWFPTFNLADIYITLGTALLVLTNLRSDQRRAAP